MARSVSGSGDGRSRPGGAGSSEGEQDGRVKAAVGRRALLTRGGVVAAGVVGAGALGAAVAGPASAQAVTAVDMNTANDAGTNVSQPTEVDADNDTAPAFILVNTGVDSTNNGAGPSLRLTTATGGLSGPFEPTASTTGGDLTSTADGQLWYTHAFLDTSGSTTTTEIVPAPVHTEATANVYAGLAPTIRVLDTRSASLRTNIINPTGNLGSNGELLNGKTILISLDNQVIFADNVFGNITVTDTSGPGFLTVWDGSGSVPNASSINWLAKDTTLSNFVAAVVGSDTSADVGNLVAITATDCDTHVILDVAGFTMPGFEYANVPVAGVNSPARSARLKRAQAKLRAAKKLGTS
jgi:hypothetical protein